MKEEEEKYFLSLLFEALGELSALSNKIHELERKIEALSRNNPKSNGLTVENSGRTVSLTKNIELESSKFENELSEEIRNDIDKAVDYVLKLGKNLPYINNK